MSEDKLYSTIRALSKPMEPVTPGMDARITRLPEVRCVLFDIYGTLFISGSGDVGTAGAQDQQPALDEALAVCGVKAPATEAIRASRIAEIIQAHHAQAKARGVEYPEVDILAVWEDLLSGVPGKEWADRELLKRLAIEYEVRINPVWPMPGMTEVLAALRSRNVLMGVVSNAQFYTPLLFPAFTKQTCDEWGLRKELCVWSYRHGEGKPSRNLFRYALSVLDDWGVRPDEVVYVGNDMRNDMVPSAELGCRTALFAGDKRSLRLREDDPHCEDLTPDVVLTELPQLLACVSEA